MSIDTGPSSLLVEFNINIDDLNYSALEFKLLSEVWIVRPSWEILIKTFFTVLIVLVSLTANPIVLYVIIKSKQLHTPMNFFILNLSIANLLNSCYSSWALLAVDFYQNFLLGDFFCRVNGFVDLACMLSGVFSLTIISADRILGIVRPFSRRMSKRTAIYIIVGIWVFALGSASPTLIYRSVTERQWADYLEIFCTEESIPIYWILIIVVLVWLPLITLAVAFAVISCTFKEYEKRIGSGRSNKQVFNSRRKIIKMLYTLLLIFFICWCPFQCLILYRNFKSTQSEYSPTVHFVGHYMTLFNCSINPFIYGMANDRFQTAFKSWIYGGQLPSAFPSTIIRPSVQLEP